MKKPKAIAANGASGGAVSKANKTKPAAVDGRTSTSTTTAAKAKKTKPALAKRNTTAAATTTATSMKRKPGEKKRKESSPSKLCVIMLFLNY